MSMWYDQLTIKNISAIINLNVCRAYYFYWINEAMPMSEITEEQFNELPEFLADKYIKDEDGGYSHSGFLKVKSTANELDSKLKATSTEFEGFKSAEQERIESAKKEAFDAAYAQALKENDRETLDKLHAEQLEDTKRRAKKEAYQEKEKEFTAKQSENEADKLSTSIALEIGANAKKAEVLSRFIRDRIKPDLETGKQVILDAEGRASTLTAKELASELLNDERFEGLVKTDIATTGGGNVGGNNSSRATNTPEKKDRATILFTK